MVYDLNEEERVSRSMRAGQAHHPSTSWCDTVDVLRAKLKILDAIQARYPGVIVEEQEGRYHLWGKAEPFEEAQEYEVVQHKGEPAFALFVTILRVHVYVGSPRTDFMSLLTTLGRQDPEKLLSLLKPA